MLIAAVLTLAYVGDRYPERYGCSLLVFAPTRAVCRCRVGGGDRGDQDWTAALRGSRRALCRPRGVGHSPRGRQHPHVDRPADGPGFLRVLRRHLGGRNLFPGSAQADEPPGPHDDCVRRRRSHRARGRPPPRPVVRTRVGSLHGRPDGRPRPRHGHPPDGGSERGGRLRLRVPDRRHRGHPHRDHHGDEEVAGSQGYALPRGRLSRSCQCARVQAHQHARHRRVARSARAPVLPASRRPYPRHSSRRGPAARRPRRDGRRPRVHQGGRAPRRRDPRPQPRG